MDYTASVQNVYASLVYAVVLKTKKLHILEACAYRGRHIQNTWAPDWTLYSRDLVADGMGVSGRGLVTETNSMPLHNQIARWSLKTD